MLVGGKTSIPLNIGLSNNFLVGRGWVDKTSRLKRYIKFWILVGFYKIFESYEDCFPLLLYFIFIQKTKFKQN